MSLSDLGPYAAYVWPAWIISALVLGGLVVRTLLAARRWTRALKAMDAAAPEPRAQAARSAVAPKS